jgi:hypothetical protein
MEAFTDLGSILGFLSPIAFVFAIGAYAYCGRLKKETKQLRKELEESKRQMKE